MTTKQAMNHANALALKNQTRPYPSGAVSELALDSLRTDDCLVITTANSTYCFLVVDPAMHRGILTGGVLGGKVVTAVLLGAKIRKSRQVSELFWKLCQGSRAIFFVASSDSVHQLTTSAIVRLVHSRVHIPQFS